MAVLCENIGLLFVSVPKAASSAIASFLIGECGGKSLLTRPIKNFLGTKILVDYRHMTVGQIVQYGLIDKARRFETVEADLGRALLSCGFKKPVRLQHVQVNSEKTKHYRAYYTPATRRIVEEAFAEDLQRFGYRF